MSRTLSFLTLIPLLAGLLLALLVPYAVASPDATHHGREAPGIDASVLAQSAALGDGAHVHAHAHDEGTDGEATGEHTHRHAAVEHLHDAAMPLECASFCMAQDRAGWRRHAGNPPASARPWQLERPPKHRLS